MHLSGSRLALRRKMVLATAVLSNPTVKVSISRSLIQSRIAHGTHVASLLGRLRALPADVTDLTAVVALGSTAASCTSAAAGSAGRAVLGHVSDA